MADSGASFDEIVRHIRDLTTRSQALLLVYKLNFLKKSGRISGVSSFAGEMLGIRPILWIRDGVVAPAEKIRGETNLIPKMIEMSGKYIDDPRNQDMYLIYADVPEEEIARCERMVLEHIKPRSLTRHPLGVAIAINTGPHAMALAFKGYPVVKEES